MAYNILIVDDSSPMRAVLKKVIKASGFDVGQIFEADDGRQALEILDQQWLDLILTDYNMPDMNGMELLQRIKDNLDSCDIPVVVVTTEGSRQRIDSFLAQGAAAYIKKPFTPEELKSKLNIILGEPDNGSSSHDAGDEELDF
jgi:two-component system chemotaxis response regulator CheY